MIRGMTGFGAAEISAGKVKGVVEIKSVNHRFTDFSYYMPPGFDSIEARIRSLLLKQIKRGRVNVFIKITKKPVKGVRFNKEVVSNYIQQSKVLKRNFQLKGELTLEQLAQMPGVVETEEYAINALKLWPSLEKAIKKALAALVEMRVREGKTLAADISVQLNRMLLRINKIKSRAKEIVKEKKKHLAPEEFVSFQKGCDINEELTRLAHHISEIKLLMKTADPSGKRIDFIAQEMQRETNTVGSKMQDRLISTAVISMKSKVEKIREQAQNAE